MLRKYAVIVAGGSGSRMGGGIPKQFQILGARPVLWWSLKAFHDEDINTEIIVVLPEKFIKLWKEIINGLEPGLKIPHLIAPGGTSRYESVKSGLSFISEEEALVAVHDGARPAVDVGMIKRGWECADKFGSAIPVVPVTDSLRKLYDNGSCSVDRKDYVAVQTPQVFNARLLIDAYENTIDKGFTDDASVVEHEGHKVALYQGSHRNIKVTNPGDLEIAAILMERNV